MSDVQQELADWIDADVIAEQIYDELADHDIEGTFENAKIIWLDVLQNGLCEAIRSSIKARVY